MSHAWPCSGWGLPSRPGHPGRWCALTAPFHPRLCGPEPAIGSLFSVALSFGSPRLAVSQHPALWSPDLPRHGPALQVRAAATRPAHRRLPVCRSACARRRRRCRYQVDRVSTWSRDPSRPARRPRRLVHRRRCSTGCRWRSPGHSRAGSSVWVRGEVQSITDRTGHCYIDLVDPDATREQTPRCSR